MTTETQLAEQLAALKLVAVAEQYAALAAEAAQKQWPHVDYLARLIAAEAQRRQQLATQRRLAAARFPCVKTLDQFDWHWPKKINRTQVQNLFRLAFLKDQTNVIFLGGVGLGKTHLVSALAYKHWPKIFNNDSTLTSAVLDRLLHHAETVVLEGKSYRMKDQIETP